LRESVLTKLGVDVTNIEETLPASASDMFPTHKALYEKLVARTLLMFQVENKKSDRRSRTIKVPQNFSLQDCFMKWSRIKERSRKSEESFASILFRDFEDNEDVKQLLSAWTIEYSGE
jgi:hypothetical protein